MTPSATGDPDLDGFQAAQRRLREKLGRVVKFYTPMTMQWPAGLPPGAFDPESGVPYDPSIEPVASGFTVASAKANTVYAPLKTIRRDDEQADATGMRSRLNKDLILDVGDYWVASAATMYELDNEFWQIVNVKKDGIGSASRIIVFGEDRSGDLSDIAKPATSGSDSNLL
ncbi:MAG: hypothetical protein NVS3B1_07850 [Marmoricola sp.]